MMFLLFKCLGQALATKGVKGLLGVVPFGELLYDVALDAVGRYRKVTSDARRRAEIEAILQASAAEVKKEARAVAKEVAGDKPAEVQQALELYLTRLPESARQSFRRLDDPTGTTVPLTFRLDHDEDLLNLLPRQLPRLRSGDQVPNARQWVLRELLGAGGFGEVWRAENVALPSLQRAFKFCLDTSLKQRMLAHEARVVALVNSDLHADPRNDGIVPLRNVDLRGDIPWLEYDYVAGGDLSGLIRGWSVLPPQARAQHALDALVRLASVVGKFHRLPEPIVHRDLKPSNILVQRGGAGYLLRLTDFGISHLTAARTLEQAHVSTPSLSLGETFRGAHTPIYASPQQKRRLKADVRDDVYALGVIGYQMLVGDPSVECPRGRWRARMQAYQLPEDVLDLLDACWDDEPEGRPHDAVDLVSRLESCLTALPGRGSTTGRIPQPKEPEQAAEKRSPNQPSGPIVATEEVARPQPRRADDPIRTLQLGDKRLSMDDESFLQALATNPLDDTLRLAYADWLQERGDDRGEFLRVTVALRNSTASDKHFPDLLHRVLQLRAAVSAAWVVRANRTLAEDDVREAVFRELLGEGRAVSGFFLHVKGGQDPSPYLLARLSGRYAGLQLASAAEVSADGVFDKQTGEQGVVLSIYGLEWVAADCCNVEGGVFVHGLNAEDNLYRVSIKDDAWAIVDVDLISIS